MAIQDFDATYYLGVKLAALQANPETASEWTSLSTTTELLTALTAAGFTAESHYEAYGISEGLYPNQAAADAAAAAGDTGDTDNSIYLADEDSSVVGTDGDDTFYARGDSSLTNASMIDGGGGTNTVEVMLDNGETALSPLLTNIDVLKVQAQSTTVDSGDNDVDTINGVDGIEANIDAGDMESVSEYWSEDSRADLTIEDVSHNSHLTTIGMRETDPGDVDYNVFFDPENITSTSGSEGDSTLTFDLVNVYSLEEDNNPLAGYTSMQFDVAVGTSSTNIQVDLVDADGAVVISTYAGLVAAVNTQLDAAGILGEATLLPAETAFFPIDVSTYAKGLESTNTYTPILITINPGVVSTTGDSYSTDSSFSDFNAFASNVSDPNQGPGVNALTSVEVVLDRVGKGSEGGDLIIGSDSTGDSDSAGIQQFNVEVDRDSWLTSISSTNDTLEVINVENVADNSAGDGSLTVNAIQDVRVFDASAMTGAVTLTADLSADVTEKYGNLTDSAADATDDNSEIGFANVVDAEFSYDFGAGDDALELTIANDNLADAGTTTREDFVLEINGGAGDDSITTTIGEGNGVAADAWYINSQLNANLTINAGAGDDTVATIGAGSWDVDLGAGNDVIYSDNSGDRTLPATDYETYDGKAVWVLNTADQVTIGAAERDIDDMESASNEDYALYKAVLTVNLGGYTVDVEIGEQNTDDLGINNAIKEAIQTDVHMKNLIAAEDGPGNILVIRSLVDGDFDQTDFSVSIASTVLTTADSIVGFDGANGDAGLYLTLADVQAKVDADVAVFNAAVDYNTAMANNGLLGLTGADSTAITESNITAGTGNDTIVLSTSDLGTETVDLGSDGEVDVVFNATNAIITGLDFEDIVVLATGTAVTGFTGDDLVSYTVGGGVDPVDPPVPGASTVIVTTADADTTGDATTGDVTFEIAAGVYTYTVDGFGTGDVLDFFAADDAVLSLVGASQTDGTDGMFSLTASLGDDIVQIDFTGVSPAADALILGVTSFETVFGVGTLVA